MYECLVAHIKAYCRTRTNHFTRTGDGDRQRRLIRVCDVIRVYV